MKRVALVIALLLAGACSSGSDKTDESSGDTTTTFTIPPRIEASVDWRARTVSVEGFDQYTIEFCEGAGPLLCVSKPGEDVLGVIELITRSDRSFNAPSFLADIERDRKQGCPGYVMRGKSRTADLAGVAGTHYSWTGELNGRTVEHVVGIAAVNNAGLHILVMNALADNGCLNRESELPLTDATKLEPVLVALAKGSTNLPNP